ncbi:hypothetical protein SAMN05444161_5297 [Rhizobiales bacterium GAS191]|nr:hypothetical protein SAMN05444161_5297 [Rhizobiales bacterium GAS191]
MNPPVYLGEAAYDGVKFARVQPRALAEDGAWRIYQDWREALPNEGKAFAPRPLRFRVGELFAFDVQPNPRTDTGPDRQIVASCVEVEEVLDFRDRDPEIARRLVVEAGLQSKVPGTSHVVVALRDGLCVRVRLEKHQGGPGFVAAWEGLNRLAVHVLDPAVFAGNKIGGRLLAVPGVTIGKQVGVTNWCPDADLLEAVLKRLRRVSGAEASPISRTQIAPLISYLKNAALLPSLGTDLEPVRGRIGTLAASLGENTRGLEELVDLVGRLRPVEARLKAAAAQRRAEIEAELRSELEGQVRAEIEARHTELIAARDRLQNELTDLEALAGLARQEAAATTAARDELGAALRDELIALQGRLEEAPGSEAVTAAELSARIAARLRARGDESELSPGESPPWARARVRPREPVRKWETAVETINGAAKYFGFSPDEMLVADVAARSGALVVLPEAEANAFVHAYASAMTCGEVVRQALDPSILSIDDLWRQPGGGRPTAFATAWAAASLDTRRFRVVLLDGLQRTPMNLWIPSLVDVVAGASRPRNLLLFASLSRDVLDPARVWQGLESAVTGLVAKRSGTLSPQILAAATGSLVPVSCFDAEAAATPDRRDIFEFVEGFSGEPVPATLRRITSVLRAAWALAPAAAPSQIASAFGDGDQADDRFRLHLVAGTEWLRSVQNSFQERRE